MTREELDQRRDKLKAEADKVDKQVASGELKGDNAAIALLAVAEAFSDLSSDYLALEE